MNAHCSPCNRTFTDSDALEQHKRDSSAHNFRCTPCDRRFSTSNALQSHQRDSPVHATPSFPCGSCNRRFGSAPAREQHQRDSHPPSFHCGTCNRSFASALALDDHRRDSPLHRDAVGSPLDAFFLSFRGFPYNRSLPSATSFSNLETHKGWDREKKARTEAWRRYQDALNRELALWFSAANDLAALHSLCRALRVQPLPESVRQCKLVRTFIASRFHANPNRQALQRKHVNLVDLVDWKRGGEAGRVEVFRSPQRLSDYTIETGRIFSKPKTEDGGNVVLKYLFRKIF